MPLFHLSKHHLDRHLPQPHQWALAALCLVLLALVFFPEAKSSQNLPAALLTLGPPLPHDYVAPLPQSLEAEDTAGADSRQWLEVKPGDSLSLVFRRAGLGPQQVAAVTNEKEQTRVLSNLFPGDNLAFGLDATGTLQNLELVKTPLESWLLTRRDDGGYDMEHLLKEPEVRQIWREAVIDDSLFLAARRNDISASLAMDLAFIFNGVVDFIQDTKTGDSFGLLYEELYLDDQYVGQGRILAAEYASGGNTHIALRYENSLGESGFYSPQGESMRKAFLLNPVDFTRISDNFSLARKHPILNTIRAHKGTDYAAPRGTPVVATADGRITFASRNGSFGKLVVIKHDDRFETKYAHLNDYGKGIKPGVRVKQGQVIGYVGATGSATGPHLHYEFLMDGVHRDSRRIHEQLPQQVALDPSELTRFKEQVQPLLASLSGQSSTVRLALFQSAGTGE
ncbi:MAG TPA: peptidoglycan DD-metalloendopeptidase family protein [Hyphomicrobiales bacterium]|nr:peptidoglycan DD-metalloendopeptidase family protein [Hyphomicrobiales bacterium]